MNDPSPSDAVAAARNTLAEVEMLRDIARATGERLAEERKQLAFVGAKGDPNAKAKLRRLAEEVRAAGDDLLTFELAIAEARVQLADAESIEANAAADDKHGKAKALAKTLLRESAKIDRAALAMVAALRTRRQLLDEILKLDALAPGLENHVIGRGALDRALNKAGLADFATLPRHNAHRASLHEQDAITMSAIRRPAPAEHRDEPGAEALPAA